MRGFETGQPFLTLAAAPGLARGLRLNSSMRDLWNRSNLRPWVIGHRGAAAHEPENTIRSFSRAVELGADLIECDVHLTKDGQLAVIHDETLDRTTNGAGPVSSKTAAELKSLDAGLGERIPLLGELLEWAGAMRELGVAIEIKPAHGDAVAARALALGVIHELRERSLAGRAIVISFDPSVLEKAHEADPGIATGFLYGHRMKHPIERARELGCSCVLPGIHLLDRPWVEQAHRQGLGVFTWTANTPDEITWALGCGVDGIASDAPDRVKEARSRRRQRWSEPEPPETGPRD